MSKTLILLGIILVLCSIIPLMNLKSTSTYMPPFLLSTNESTNPPIIFIAYLYKYDTIDFKYKFTNVEKWRVNITITNLFSNRVWNFYDEGRALQPLTPIFRAPSTGIYLIKIRFYNVLFEGSEYQIFYHLIINSSKVNVRYQCLMSRLNIMLILGFTLILVGLVVRISKLPRFMQLLAFELYGMWKTYMIVMFTLILLMLRLQTTSILVQGYSPFAFNVNLGAYIALYSSLFSGFINNTEILWLLMLMYSGIISTSVFAYEIESKIWRDKILYGISRRKLYVAKLISLTLAILIPIAVPHLALLISIGGDLCFSNPTIMVNILAYRFICDLIVVALLLSYVLLPSILLNRYIYALLLIITIPYVVTLIEPKFSILYHTFGRLLLPKYVVHSLLPYGFEAVLLSYMIILLLSIIIGLIVVRYRDYA